MALGEDGTTGDRLAHNGMAWATTIFLATARGFVMYGYDKAYALNTLIFYIISHLLSIGPGKSNA